MCAALVALGCQPGATTAPIGDTAQPAASRSMSLRVALYPYVPRLDQFKKTLKNSWQRPDVFLELVSWDCYESDPPGDLDVFVFDAIFLDYFRDQGYLAPIRADEIHELGDFLPYAITGARMGDVYHALPQLGCASMLFYREGDQELARATTLADIASAVGACRYTDAQPPPGTGLMIDMSGGTTNASYYVEADEDLNHRYTPSPTLPPASELDPKVMAQLRQLLSLASVNNARSYSDDQPYQRATWFGQGLGRATVGFTESMSAMGEARDRVDFKPLPMDGQPDVTLFYSDMIGINRAIIDPVKRAAALELANLLASTDYLTQAFGPGANTPIPQYLMPVRESVFRELGERFPLYQEMQRVVSSVEPHLFRLGPQSRPWLEANKSAIRQAIFAQPICAPLP